MTLFRRLPLLAALLVTILLGSCDKQLEFTIVSGSENQVLEPRADSAHVAP